MIIDKILEHYGTRGMKWGIRKRNVSKQGPSTDAKEAHRSFVKAKVSGPEALSNKELSTLNNRLNLEQNYSRLSYNPGKLKKGLDQVNSLLKTGKTVDQALQFAESDVAKQMGINFTSKATKLALLEKAAKAASKS